MNDRINRTKHPGFVVALLLVLASAWSVTAALGQPPGETTVLRAARILDGRGEVLEDRDLVLRDGRITEIVPRGDGRGDRVYDLTALTVLPGYLDTHVHIGNHFDDDGRVHRDENDPGVAHLTLHGAENAYRTLMNGITTMQSLGSPDDAELRAWIDRGEIPGPRLLSSLGAVRDDTGTPDEIRAYVRERAAAGADVIKVFASTSIRFGGVTNMTAAQLEAACGEARAQGLRSVVHLHRSDALRLTADAGCTQVEHGWMLEPGDVDLFVESGMYLGNQIDLLFRNYEERGDRYAGVGGYTLEGFANLQASRPGALAFFRAAAATPGVRIVYSTDANAGSHGANTDELVAYVEQGGQDPMDAVVSATSLAAESLGLEDRIGAIATGFEADIIALDGDPLTDPAALGRVVFVMRGGHVYKNDPPRAAERSTVQSRLSAAVRELVTPRGPEEQAAAIDFDILKTDTDLYADALARLPSAPRVPVDPTSQVGALGEALERRAEEAGHRFDLAEAIRRQRLLLELVSEVDAGATLPLSAPLDLALLRILQPLHRVRYSPSDPLHPDPRLDSSALPSFWCD